MAPPAVQVMNRAARATINGVLIDLAPTRRGVCDNKDGVNEFGGTAGAPLPAASRPSNLRGHACTAWPSSRPQESIAGLYWGCGSRPRRCGARAPRGLPGAEPPMRLTQTWIEGL